MSNAPEKKGVSAVDFFCIGFGAIVGVGWAVSINGWMASCGGPIPAGIGYLVVLIMMVPIGLCYAELVPMLPVAGGGMAFAFRAFNDKVAMLSGWASLGGMIAIIPWEAIQITDVLRHHPLGSHSDHRRAWLPDPRHQVWSHPVQHHGL